MDTQSPLLGAQRIAVFIDAQNLYHTARKLYNSKVNFSAVLSQIVGNRLLSRALAYVIETEEGDETQFIEALHKAGIETRSKDLQIFSNGAKKGDWDVGLCIDAVSIVNRVDTVALVTGDGDFVPLIQYLRSHGVRVEVVSFGRSTSGMLREAADEFTDLDTDARKFLIRSRNTNFRKPAPKKRAA
jgi:uncharacterized protein (TIGR00288 family)